MGFFLIVLILVLLLVLLLVVAIGSLGRFVPSMQILEMQCIGHLQVPGPSSGIWQVGIVLETFEDEEKQFRAVEFVSRAAELFYFIFYFS